MVEESAPTDDEFLRRELEVERILRLAVREALLEHKKLGRSIAVWKGNRVVTLTADEIPVDEDDDRDCKASESA
jgi:hypothetical protein